MADKEGILEKARVKVKQFIDKMTIADEKNEISERATLKARPYTGPIPVTPSPKNTPPKIKR